MKQKSKKHHRSLEEAEKFPELTNGVVGVGDGVTDGPGVGEDFMIVAA